MHAFITFFMNKYRYPFKLSLTYMYIKPSLSKYFFFKCEDILGIFQMKSYICRVYAVIHENQYMRLIG